MALHLKTRRSSHNVSVLSWLLNSWINSDSKSKSSNICLSSKPWLTNISFRTHTLISFYFFSSSMSKSREQLEEQGMGAHFHWVSPLNQNMARIWRSLTAIKNSLMINFSSKAWCGYLLTSVGWLHSRLMELSIPAITTLLSCCLAMHRKSWKER